MNLPYPTTDPITVEATLSISPDKRLELMREKI